MSIKLSFSRKQEGSEVAAGLHGRSTVAVEAVRTVQAAATDGRPSQILSRVVIAGGFMNRKSLRLQGLELCKFCTRARLVNNFYLA